jgi:hypothetical protein
MIFQFKADARQGSTALPSTRCLEEDGAFLQQSCKLSGSKRLSVTNANDSGAEIARAAALERIPGRRKSPTPDARR